MKESKDNMIHIGADWALQGDEICITLYKRRVSGKGKEQYDARGYYNDFHEAYKAMIKKSIGPLNNVEMILKVLDAVCDEIQKLPKYSI